MRSSCELFKYNFRHIYIGYEKLMELAGLRAGEWAREHITNVHKSLIAQGSTTNISNCSIDYTKDFDCVQNLKMWNSIKSVGIPMHMTVLIQELHTE